MSNIDVAVIGAGPAGLAAAIAASDRGLKTVVFEHAKFPLRKLLISGKGRCNITNNCSRDDYLRNVIRGSRFLYSSSAAFGPSELMEFITSLGVELKTERGGRVFPVSDKASDIADALLAEAGRSGVEIRKGNVTGVLTEDGKVAGVELADGNTVKCRGVVIATGGVSYPGTGSDGSGYRIAKKLGHTTNDPVASLVPIVCEEDWCIELEGLSLRNVTLTAKKGKKVVFSELGEMLFTPYGITGPLVLSLSSVAAMEDWSEIKLSIDLKPALDFDQLDARILRDFSEGMNRDFRNSLSALLPRKMIPVIVKLSGIEPDKKLNSLKANERRRLVELIKHLPLTPVGPRPVSEAIVTAGGIKTKEINPTTMMSKIVKNLHFAGEVIDIDALTGGYNLTAAFSTGYAAGKYILSEEDE